MCVLNRALHLAILPTVRKKCPAGPSNMSGKATSKTSHHQVANATQEQGCIFIGPFIIFNVSFTYLLMWHATMHWYSAADVLQVA